MQLIFPKITKYRPEKMNRNELRKMEVSSYLDVYLVSLRSQEHLETLNVKFKVTPQTKTKNNSSFVIQK